MTNRLFVYWQDSRVGLLQLGADTVLELTYDSKWLTDRRRFPISLSLPLRRQPHRGAAHAFFANLLPEGDLRRLLCRRLGISADNDFEILAAIGGECAGALSIFTEDHPADSKADVYRPLSHSELTELARTRVLPALDGRKGLRLSLAGAQDKLPVRIDGRSISIPLGSAPSTHILKFPNPTYRHLPANEVLTTLIARNAGLPVVEVELWELRKEGMSVTARYDRVRTADGKIERAHQEDLCQALGLPAARKYEKEGGPSFARCFERVRTASVDALADAKSMLAWVAFNALALNADGHAKNLSILYGPSGPRLAPSYDLICTRAYPRVSTDMATAIGGEVNPTLLRRHHWLQLADELGLGHRFVLDSIRELALRFPAAAAAGATEFRQKYGEAPALQMVIPKVQRQAKRLLQGLL